MFLIFFISDMIVFAGDEGVGCALLVGDGVVGVCVVVVVACAGAGVDVVWFVDAVVDAVVEAVADVVAVAAADLARISKLLYWGFG